MHTVFFSSNPVQNKKTVHFGVVKGDVEIVDSDSNDEEEEERAEKLRERARIINWRTTKLSDEEGTVYIKNYKGSPILLELSMFKQTGTQQQKESGQSGAPNMLDMLGNLGLKLTSIN